MNVIDFLMTLLTSISKLDSAPAGDPGDGSSVEHTVRRGQADGHDVLCELHRRGELQEADIVIAGVAVVIRVSDDLHDRPGHLILVDALLVLTAQDDVEACRVIANRKKTTKMRSVATLTQLKSSIDEQINMFLLLPDVED